MSIFSRFLPKRKPVEIKNNIPKEKNNIRKTFGVYCHAHPGAPRDGHDAAEPLPLRHHDAHLRPL